MVTVEVAGFAAGCTALIIACYFQWIVGYHVPARYVMGFTLVGWGIIMITISPFIPYEVISDGAKLIGFFLIIVIEIWGFVAIRHQFGNTTVAEVVVSGPE